MPLSRQRSRQKRLSPFPRKTMSPRRPTSPSRYTPRVRKSRRHLLQVTSLSTTKRLMRKRILNQRLLNAAVSRRSASHLKLFLGAPWSLSLHVSLSVWLKSSRSQCGTTKRWTTSYTSQRSQANQRQCLRQLHAKSPLSRPMFKRKNLTKAPRCGPWSICRASGLPLRPWTSPKAMCRACNC